MKAVHGGDLRALAAASGRRPDDILDFSANVNPLGPPEGVARALRSIADRPSLLSAYPDPTYVELREALARRHAIDARRIVVGNGSAAVIGAIVRALRPERCVLPVPAFSEYEKALRDAHVDVRRVPLRPHSYELDTEAILRTVKRTGATLCIAANPNNPTGGLTPRAGVGALARDLASVGCTLVVDEAFVDYVPGASCVGDDLPAIVVRSLTKFYALPGMRVGYAVAPRNLADAIALALPSWPVGTVDAAIAIAAIGDDAYDERTRTANAIERARLERALETLGATVARGAANFLFVDVAPLGTTAERLAATLLRRDGIAIRTCDDYDGLPRPTFVRIAVRTRVDDDRLLRAIEAASGPTEKRTAYLPDDEEPS